jgi:hypothetical protein
MKMEIGNKNNCPRGGLLAMGKDLPVKVYE